MAEQGQWLTVEEVAASLRVTKDTVRRWCQSGKLRATFLSRRAGYRIQPGEVSRILNEDRPEYSLEPTTENDQRIRT